jgi:hypothetical protein
MKRESMKQRWIFGAILLAIIAIFFPALQAFGAVTLKYFEVSYVSNRVKLRWETATELDNLGFLVKKKITGSSESFQTVKLCAKATPCSETEKQEFIFAEGGNFGQTYGDFFDDDIQPGTSYTYQLIAVDTSQREEVAETKTVVITGTTPAVTATSTVTATLIPTNPPPTATPRQGNPNPPRTRTPTLTATIRLIQPTATLLPTATSQPPTEIPAPTATETDAELIIPTLPLPSITLVFPDTPTPELVAPTETPQAGSIPQNATWFTPSRLLVIGLIVMVWVILGGWFVFALRKIQ